MPIYTAEWIPVDEHLSGEDIREIKRGNSVEKYRLHETADGFSEYAIISFHLLAERFLKEDIHKKHLEIKLTFD